MKRLYRTQDERKLAGICGGISKYVNIDPTIIRILFVILLFPTGFFPLIIAYIVGVFIIPNEQDVRS